MLGLKDRGATGSPLESHVTIPATGKGATEASRAQGKRYLMIAFLPGAGAVQCAMYRQAIGRHRMPRMGVADRPTLLGD